MRVVTCEMCGTGFQCGRGDVGCWCTAVLVSSERRKEIALKASDCVCRQCLTGYRQKSPD